jgi:hypothetical protein
MTWVEVSKFLNLTKASSQYSIHSKILSFVRRVTQWLKYYTKLFDKPPIKTSMS